MAEAAKKMRKPIMMETALFMRSRGYSERSIQEITGLSERELLRWYALERLAGGGRRGGSVPPAARAGALRIGSSRSR